MTTARPPVESGDGLRKKGPMEHVIESVASAGGNSVGWMAEHGILFAIFTIAWLAFAAGLIFSQGSVDGAWEAIRALPVLVQIVIWLLFLPVMAGLWIWESTLPLLIRLALVLGLGAWNLLVLLPRAVEAKP